MRLFPPLLRHALTRPHGRGLGASALLALIVSAALAAPFVQPQLSAQEDDHLRDRQRHLRHELNAAHNDLDESSARARRTTAALESARVELTSAKDALSVARGKLTVARIKDQQMQRELDDAVTRLAQARSDLAQGQLEVAQKRDEIANLLADTYQQGDPQLLNLAALLNSESPAELTSEAQTSGVVVETQVQKLDELRAAEVLLGVREDEVTEAKQETSAKRREAAQVLAERQKLEQQAEAAKQAYHARVLTAREAKSAADEALAADRKQLKQIEAEQAQVRDMLRRRAARAAARHGGGSPQPSDGYLSYPVNGPVTSPFGYRVHPIYGYYSLHDGTDFGAGCGQPLYSAAAGRVISSYWSTAYGNRMIIDNGFVRGVSLATIYNHAVRYTVGVSDRVSRGQVIGYVGTTGWSTGCHLHFTVMVNGDPVDPMTWL
ncbi:MAG: peptidoglycan DD-metalloendopeptidase family protein [Nocardioidaceae bacterium]